MLKGITGKVLTEERRLDIYYKFEIQKMGTELELKIMLTLRGVEVQ